MRTEPSTARPDAPLRYSGFAQWLHWATAVLVLVAFIYGPGGPEAHVYASSRDADRHLHEMLGSSVLCVSVIRLAWRAFARRPDPAPGNRWMGPAAKAVQGALYALLFAVPLTAVFGAWLEGHPLAYPGGLEVAPPIAPSHDVGATLATIHSWLGDVILWVAGLHAVAAIWHHAVLKDGVLASMLPAWRLPGPRRGRD